MINKTEQEIMKNWRGDKDTPVVGICCITYNHEKYIGEAIDSFLMQETDFPFEIFIDDDCSPDNTADVIRAYSEKYPNIINANLRAKNVGANQNSTENMQRAKGKYIAFCEGDDYWINPLKLQKQYEALENHSECSFAGHDTNLITHDNKYICKHSKGRISENWHTGIKNNREALSAIWSVPHTSAMFVRKEHLDFQYFEKTKNKLGGDYLLFVLLCSKGNLYYINDQMSAYRKHNTSTSVSWSYVYNDEFMNEVVRSHNVINEYFNYAYDYEINRHLRGQFMQKYKDQMDISIQKGYIFETMKNLTWMFLHHNNSQYSVRDILWLFKEKLKERKSEGNHE